MRLHDFFHEVETELNGLLWGDPVQASAATRPSEVQLREAQVAELERRQKVVQDFQQRVTEKAHRIADLAKRIRVFINLRDDVNAWRLAMTLDNLRQVLDHERSELQNHQAAYDRQLRRVQNTRRLSA